MSGNETPRVWIGCLACYNAGALVGEWFDAVDAVAEGEAFHEQYHAQFPPMDGAHDELWCMDLEGFGPMLTGECSPAHAQQVAELIEAVDEHLRPAFMAWYGNESRDLDDDLVEGFTEQYRGEYDSLADFAETFTEETGGLEGLPEQFRYYIDWAAMGRDFDVWTAEADGGGVWVFGN